MQSEYYGRVFLPHLYVCVVYGSIQEFTIISIIKSIIFMD